MQLALPQPWRLVSDQQADAPEPVAATLHLPCPTYRKHQGCNHCFGSVQRCLCIKLPLPSSQNAVSGTQLFLQQEVTVSIIEHHALGMIHSIAIYVYIGLIGLSSTCSHQQQGPMGIDQSTDADH